MNIKSLAISILLFSLLGGCVTNPQGSVQTGEEFWKQNSQIKVGVVMTSLPTLDVFLPGASCLLCLIAAETANSSLSKHVNTLSIQDLGELKAALAKNIETKGASTVIIDDAIDLKKLSKFKSKLENSAVKDYSSYSNQDGITHLAVIHLRSAGMNRTYANYIPTSDPKAVFSGSIYMVDLATNTYQSYESFSISKAARSNWKESPNFPALTNAFYQAIESGKEIILNSLLR